MRKTRILAVLLCAMTIVTMSLSGCGGKEKDVKEVSGIESDKVDENGKVNGVFYEKGLPIVDKDTYGFSIFCDDGSKDGKYYMIDELEKQTNVNVDIQYFPNEVALEKLSLALSSGDYTDMIGGWILKDTDILKYGVDQKIFIPIEDYIKKYAPNIEAVLNLEGVRETMTAPDGHIYSIPYVNKAPLVDFSPSINTKWLENLGLEMPKTTEEFKAVLREFKAKDANGNGDPNDEIPFSADPNNKHIGYMCGWFGMSVDDYGMTMKDGKLTFGANTEEYKKGIKFLNELYKEGLIDSEIFTQDLSQWKAKGAQDRYGCSMMWASSDLISYNAGVTPTWLPLPVLVGEEGVEPVWYKDSEGISTLKTQVVITDKAKNPGAILRWWDNAFELDNSLQIQAGPLGTSIIKEGDIYRQMDISTLPEDKQVEYAWGNLFPQSLPHYTPADFKFVEDVPIYQEKDVADKEYEPYLTEVVPEYWVSLDDVSKMSDIQTPLKDYMAQKTAEWVSGQADIDKDWDAYCKELDALGLQDYIEIRQKSLETPAAE